MKDNPRIDWKALKKAKYIQGNILVSAV